MITALDVQVAIDQEMQKVAGEAKAECEAVAKADIDQLKLQIEQMRVFSDGDGQNISDLRAENERLKSDLIKKQETIQYLLERRVISDKERQDLVDYIFQSRKRAWASHFAA